MGTDQAITYSQKRLNKTINHVLRLWIPINRPLLERVKKGLERGSYDNNRLALIGDLKSDLSLYTWCLRRLCQTVSSHEKDDAFDPVRELEKVELSELKEILNVEEHAITEHRLDHSDELQVQILREAMLGASAAKTLAEKKGGDDRAYGASLLRQLGLTLIAWNYPSVFQNAMKAVQDGADLDTEISNKLGFSPGLLATKLVQQWGISEQQCRSLGLPTPPTHAEGDSRPRVSLRRNEEPQRKGFLEEVCELGEKLARANNPEAYPALRHEWEEIEEEIRETLGPQGMSKIRETFEEQCVHYTRLMPEIVEPVGHISDKRRYPDSGEVRELYKRNKFIEDCTLNVQAGLRRLYHMINAADQVDQENLRILIHDTIPAAGFSGGCVFTIDPACAKLVPQLQFGEVVMRRIRSIECTMDLSNADFVAAAYQRSDPSTELRTSAARDYILVIGGSVGRRRRMGVLYVETPVNTQSGNWEQQIIHFKAIGRAFNDCLNL